VGGAPATAGGCSSTAGGAFYLRVSMVGGTVATPLSSLPATKRAIFKIFLQNGSCSQLALSTHYGTTATE
jgi:hypothetical protein